MHSSEYYSTFRKIVDSYAGLCYNNWYYEKICLFCVICITFFHEEEFPKMMKRFFALTICLLMLLSCFASCSFQLEEKKKGQLSEEEEEELKGGQITMYLTDLIFDFDPANAYNNEAAMKVISLLYEPTFYLDEKGKIKSNLIEKYTYTEDPEKDGTGEYKLSLHLADTYWSDGTYVSANDFVFSWKRLIEVDSSYGAACLLFDIKNARLANQGDASIDSIGLSAPSDKLVEIYFEGPIDVDQFLRNLTSYALAPLRENLATKSSYYEITLGTDPQTGEAIKKKIRLYNDWAKKGATMAGSGPFKVRTVKYPDDPVEISDGKYLLNENGEFLYCYYVQDATDPAALVKLEKGVYYYLNENGEKLAYSPLTMADYEATNPAEYNRIKSTCEVVRGVASDYATTPQNAPQIILERNSYYFKDMDKDNWKVDEVVIPYRLIIDYSKSDEELMAAYENEEIFYVGDIPLSVRSNYADSATVTDGLSTHTYYLNENAIVKYSWISYDDNGIPMLYDSEGLRYIFDPATMNIITSDENGRPIRYKNEYDENGKLIYFTEKGAKVYTGADGLPVLGENILSSVNVRVALSQAINRETIANAVVFAEAAGALVPPGVFNSTSAKKTFREKGANYLLTTDDLAAAQATIGKTDIDPKDYVLKLSYAAYDEVHEMIATTVKAAWESLGFVVELDPLRAVDNEHYWTTTEEILSDVKDDMWLESLVAGDYQILAMDMVSYSVDSFGVLAPFATLFSGMGMNMQNFDEYGEPQYIPATHITGFADETYNDMVEAIFAEKNIEKRAELLHAAEEYLLSQMPVIPIVYNRNAVLVNDDMLTDCEGNYYAPAGFKNCYLKGTRQYRTHIRNIWITVGVVTGSVLLVSAIVFFTVRYRIKTKKREEEIARISAEQEAKLREIRRPGSRS